MLGRDRSPFYPGAAAGHTRPPRRRGLIHIAVVTALLSVISGWIGAHSLAIAPMCAIEALQHPSRCRATSRRDLFQVGLISAVWSRHWSFWCLQWMGGHTDIITAQTGCTLFGGLLAGGLAVGWAVRANTVV